MTPARHPPPFPVGRDDPGALFPAVPVGRDDPGAAVARRIDQRQLHMQLGCGVRRIQQLLLQRELLLRDCP